MKPSSTPARPRHRGRKLPAAIAGLLLCAALLPPAALAQQTGGGARFRGQPVTLNFVNADIEGVARAMSAILNQQFIVDPRVKGTMTLYSEEPLSPNAAYLNFLASLRGLGFTVVEVGGLFKIVPEADAKLQTGTVTVGEATSRRGDQVVTQVFRLTHENANNLVAVLRPLISPNNTINANPGNNTLVITDYADNLTRIGKIIAAMDTPAAGDVEVLPLKYAVASDIVTLVQRLTDSAGTAAGAQAAAQPGGAGGGTNGASVLVDARSNSLLVRAPNPSRMASIRALVEKLDQPMQGVQGSGNIWVVSLKNADAVKLATVLRAAYGGGSGPGGGASSGSSTPFSSGNSSTFGGATNTSAPGGSTASGASQQSTAPLSASGSPSTGGFVQADPATNSLIITGPEPMYRQLRVLIDQLDSRRAQVYIESMIVEVTGDNSADFGFQWQGLISNSSNTTGIVAGTNYNAGGSASNNIIGITTAVASGTASSLTLGEGLNVGLVKNFFGTYGLGALARILQSQANTNIVSTPNLITLDNEEAKIVVGQNVPFITGSYTNTGTGTTSPFQTVERKDVGITLRIKPQIGENGTIRMVIYQESSSVATTTAVGTTNAGPTTNKRSIESTVTVDDGSIIVLGGLIEDRYTDNKSQIPLLGDIPYVGALFRSESRSKTRTNLMVFLRPVVMRDNDSTNRLSVDRYDMIRATQQAAQPKPSVLVPVNDPPVMPPALGVERAAPLSAPPTSPGTQRSPLAPLAPAPSPPPQNPAVEVAPQPGATRNQGQ